MTTLGPDSSDVRVLPDTEERDIFADLLWHYEHPLAVAQEKHQADIPVIGYTSNTVPWEILRAAGFFPLLLSSRRPPTLQADAFMEPFFERRVRSIFDSVLSGDWSFLRLLIIPRTSEQEYKLFLYLREVARKESRYAMPPLYLYDLLHTRSSRSETYGVDRTMHLQAYLEELSGRSVSASDLRDAIHESNAARAPIRRLLHLRREPRPRLSGTSSFSIIGAWYFMDRADYAVRLNKAIEDLGEGKPLGGPRIMIQGLPLDHPGLHRAIEMHGAIVVAEDDWWGSRSAGLDVNTEGDVITGIFHKYYLDAPSPRVFPREISDGWFNREALRGIDGVVFYLPPDDDVYGWDYPRRRRFLDENGIPNLLVREDALEGAEASPELNDRLGSFISGISGARS